MSVLIVTATVTPGADVPKLVVRDPQARLGEYLTAWPHHLQAARSTGMRVVLTENSGADLSPFRAAAERAGLGEAVELMSVAPSPGRYGRGYGELKMIETALRESRVIADLPPDTLIWKVTGRYRVLNLRQLSAGAPAVDVYCNLRRFSLRRLRRMEWMDQWAFAMTRTGFELCVAPAIAALERAPGASSELLLFEQIHQRRDEPRIVPRFDREPRVSGVRAWNGGSYDSVRSRLYFLSSAVLRRVLPGLWI